MQDAYGIAVSADALACTVEASSQALLTACSGNGTSLEVVFYTQTVAVYHVTVVLSRDTGKPSAALGPFALDIAAAALSPARTTVANLADAAVQAGVAAGPFAIHAGDSFGNLAKVNCASFVVLLIFLPPSPCKSSHPCT